MRQILHAHRDAKYAAIDNPGAVVVDYDTRTIWLGLDRWSVRRPQVFRFIAFMLRSADLVQHRTAIAEALGNRSLHPSRISDFARASETIFRKLGMVLETVYGTGGYQLHTEPRESLPCCRNLAPGQPLPWRLRNTLAAPGMPLTTCARLPARSTTSSAPSSSRQSR